MRVLVSRPRDDAERIAAPLRALGVDVVNEPLLVIVPVAGPDVDLQGVQALLMTSANGARALSSAIDQRDIPVFAVGDQTARAARELEFKRVESAGGDVVKLAELVRQRLKPTDGVLLHAAGSVQAGDLAGALSAHGFQVRIVRLYESRQTAALSKATQTALRTGAIDAAFFFSPRTARTFVEHVHKAELVEAMAGLTAFALSPAVARELDPVLSGRIRVAEQPTQEALLDVFKADLKEVPLKQPENAQKGAPSQTSGMDRSAGSSATSTPNPGTSAQPTTAGDPASKAPPKDAAKAPTKTETPDAPKPATETAAGTATEAAKAPASAATEMKDAEDRDAEDKAAEDTVAEDKAAEDKAAEDKAAEDKAHDDGDGLYAGSAGHRPSKAKGHAARSEEEQADHRTMRSATRWLALLIVLGAVGYGSMPWWRDNVPAQFQGFLPAYPEAAEPASVAALRTRVDTLSDALEDLRASVGDAARTADEALTAATGDELSSMVDSAAVEALRDRLARLEQRLTEQTASVTGGSNEAAVSAGRFDALEDTLETAQSDVAALGGRMEAIETDLAAAQAALAGDQTRTVGLLLSIGLLRDRVNTGQPYSDALAAVAAIGPGDAAVEDMDILGAHAGTGVMTVVDLRRAFDGIKELAARRTIVPEGDSWWSDMLPSLMDSITVRRKDEVIAGGGLAALSSAEVLLAENNLLGAIEALSKLDGDAAKVVADWMADAQARASADAALASLNAAALAQVGQGPLTE